MRFWVVFLIVLAITFTAYLAGVRVMNTSGTSMEPLLHTGDLIVIYAKDPAEIEKGDVVTYRVSVEDRTYFITHRVVGMDEKGFITKGDNLGHPDSHVVMPEDVVGVYITKLPKVGLLGGFVRTFWGYLLLILIPGIALLVMEMKNIAGELR